MAAKSMTLRDLLIRNGATYTKGVGIHFSPIEKPWTGAQRDMGVNPAFIRVPRTDPRLRALLKEMPRIAQEMRES